MATPRGAKHQDLEQRLRDLETKVRELTSANLRREQLKVNQGDFVVSGGGGVVVQDGGYLRVEHPNGTASVYGGDIVDSSTGAYEGTGLLVTDDTGRVIAELRTDATGSGAGQFGLFDKGGRRVIADDGVSGFGLAQPHLQYPMYPSRSIGSIGMTTATETSMQEAWSGGVQVWHPYLDVAVAYSINTGTGYYRMDLDGSTVVSSTAFTGAGYAYERIDLRGLSFGSTHRLTIHVRSSVNSSAAGIRPYYVRGGQS